MTTNYQRLWPILILALVAAIEVALIGSMRLPAMIDPDTAQLMTAARNLMAGDGISTSALYYEEQFALGAPPVPLTVWPPGMAIAALPFLALGISTSTSAFIVSAIGHVATILLTYWLCRLGGLSRVIALAVGMAVACLAFSFTLLADGYSEPAFIAATLASGGLLFLSRESPRPVALLIASGAFATVAISFRYAGLAWLAAGLAAVALFHFRSGFVSLLARCAAFGVLPVAFCAVLFARNLSAVGTLTGGPLLGGDSNLGEIAQNSYWALLRLFGATGSRIGILVLLAVVAALGAWWAWRVGVGVIRDLRFRTQPPPRVRDHLAVIALAYVGATGALMLYLSITAYPGFVKERYLIPVVPFVLVAAGLFFADLREGVSRFGRAGSVGLAVAVAIVAVAFVAGQYRVNARQMSFAYSTSQVRVIDAVNLAKVGDEPLTDYLRRTVSVTHPIVADRGQVLSAIIDRPTIELPLPEYSRLTYDEQTVRDLMQRMNSCLLLIHPATTAAATGDRRVLLQQLSAGYRPDWLTEVVNDGNLLLFAVAGCGSNPA